MNVELQCGDVILMHNKGHIGKIIRRVLRFFQNDAVQYSHVAIAVSENNVTEALWSGIRIRTLEKSIEKASAAKIIRYKHLTDEQKEWIEVRALSKVGTSYNYYRLVLQLFDNLFGTNWFTRRLRLTKDLNICSTYVAWVMMASE